jgi:hypothetical protein
MKCLRSSYKSFDPTVTSTSFSIRCFLNEEGSKRCQQCIQRRDLCLRPSEGMWGDANDLVAILEWIAWMFTPDNAYLALDAAFLESVNDATLKLVKDFEHAHKAHESAHGLSSAVKKDVSRVSDSVSTRWCFANISIENMVKVPEVFRWSSRHIPKSFDSPHALRIEGCADSCALCACSKSFTSFRVASFTDSRKTASNARESVNIQALHSRIATKSLASPHIPSLGRRHRSLRWIHCWHFLEPSSLRKHWIVNDVVVTVGSKDLQDERRHFMHQIFFSWIRRARIVGTMMDRVIDE